MIIIIGTGLAGYQLARELRKINSTAPLMLVTADEGKFYSKPQLSTALTQKKTAMELATADAETMATQLNADIRTFSPVTHIDSVKQEISIGHETFSYSKLVLACGAEVIKPPIEGNATHDILFINHLYHYAEFEKLLQNKKHITLLGSGLIGCEFANDLSNAGYEVHVISPDHTPLQRFIPDPVGKLLQTALEQNGVHFHLQQTASRMDKVGERYQLHLTDGTQLLTELVISAIGLKPHITLAKEAGLVVSRGIVVNRYLETSANNIYALGDCAEVEGHVLPFITPLLNCSRALAKTLSGEKTSADYPAMPVTVKTPAHPIVVCPPPAGMQGSWQIEQTDRSVRALFYNTAQQLQGFVLTHDAVKERMALTKQVPGLF